MQVWLASYHVCMMLSHTVSTELCVRHTAKVQLLHSMYLVLLTEDIRLVRESLVVSDVPSTYTFLFCKVTSRN